jgi:hypothetical protein
MRTFALLLTGLGYAGAPAASVPRPSPEPRMQRAVLLPCTQPVSRQNRGFGFLGPTDHCQFDAL